jgi:PAS domain S-box-containing protein
MTTAPVALAPSDPAASVPAADAPEGWRDTVARGMLTVSAVVGPLLAALGLFVGSTHRDRPDVAVLAAAGILMPVLRMVSAISIRRRALAAIFVMFAVSVYLLARAGFGSGVSDVIITTCVLGGILFDCRLGQAMTGASALAHVVIGLLVARRIVLLDPREVDPLLYVNWLRMAASTTLLAVLLARVTSFVIRYVETSARATARAFEQLRGAHESLRESEERYRSVVDHCLDGVLLGTPTGETLEANPAACQLLQWSPEEFRSRGRGGVLDVEDPRFLAMLEETRQTARTRGELAMIRKDGSRIPVELAVSLFADRNGSPRASVSFRDITDRKRAERDHRILAELGAVLSPIRYESPLAEVAPLVARDLAELVMFYVVQPDGDLARGAAATRDPALAWAAEVLMRDRSFVRADHPARQVLREQRPVLRRFTPETRQQTVEPEELTRALLALQLRSSLFVPLLVGDTCLGVLGLGSSPEPFDEKDIPLVVEIGRRCALFMESARLHRSERRATQMRDEVLQIMAHDLRNPLGSAMMNVALLRRPHGQPERRSTRPLEALERATRRMSRLLDDLLEVSRLEAGQLELVRAPVEPAELVTHVEESQRDSIESRKLAFRTEVAPDLPEVSADASKVLQVLENLIGNALKFTTAGSITVGAEAGGREVVFWVADTGSGIAAEEIPHVFDRFWQAKRSERSGAGLGLAIVHGIIQAHGGRVWLESTFGAGSTFFFSLPRIAPVA